MKKIIFFVLKFGLILPLFIACQKNSLEEFKAEGMEITYQLVREMQKIETRQQLIEASPRLESLFLELVDVMIAAQDFKNSHIVADEEGVKAHSKIAQQLRMELNRLYQIEGGRQIIEKCEENALQRLDLYEKKNQILH